MTSVTRVSYMGLQEHFVASTLSHYLETESLEGEWMEGVLEEMPNVLCALYVIKLHLKMYNVPVISATDLYNQIRTEFRLNSLSTGYASWRNSQLKIWTRLADFSYGAKY